jgi:hypothetical protein
MFSDSSLEKFNILDDFTCFYSFCSNVKCNPATGVNLTALFVSVTCRKLILKAHIFSFRNHCPFFPYEFKAMSDDSVYHIKPLGKFENSRFYPVSSVVSPQ